MSALSSLPLHSQVAVYNSEIALERAQDVAAERKRRLMAEVQLLRARYTAGLPDKIAQLEAMWQHLDCASQDENPDGTATKRVDRADVSMSAFYRLVHNLAGSGATYGFPALSRAARELTNVLKPWSDPDLPLRAQPPLKRELCQHIEILLAEIKIAAE